MRKLLSVLIILCILPLSALADQEILFRGIPWGTSASELEKKDFFQYGSFSDSSMPFEDSFTEEARWRAMAYIGTGTDHDAGFEATCYGKIKVAGFETSSIHLYCAYSIENGELVKDKSKSRFYGADYVFNPLDYAFAYNTLVQKLTDLYGEGTEEKIRESTFLAEGGNLDTCEMEMAVTRWDGANDTHLIIVGQWIVDEEKIEDKYSALTRDAGKKLFIVYYKGGMDEELRQMNLMQKKLEMVQEQNQVEGYDGL